MKLLANSELRPLTVHQVHEQITFLNRYGSIYLWSNLIGATFFAVLSLVAEAESVLLIGIWYVAILAINALRWMIDLEFKPTHSYASYQLDSMLSRYVMYTTLINTLWGATGLLLFSSEIGVQATHAVLLAVILMATLPLLMISRHYMYIQIAILLVPIILSLSIVGEVGQSALAVALLLIGVVVGSMTRVLEGLLARLGELQQSLIEQTNKDQITQIPNRRYFEQSLKVEWQRAARSGESVALLMVDVDHFKLFNDLQGHHAGDECLRRLAQELRKVAKRTSDVVVRYGEDQFAVLLPNTHIHDATLLAERMREAIEALQINHSEGDFERVLTISVGVSSCFPTIVRSNEPRRPTDMLYPAVLINAVERALYKAKRGSRNQVVKELCGDEEISRAAMHMDQLRAAKVA